MEKSAGKGLLKRTQLFLIAFAAVPLLLAIISYYASVEHAKSVAAALATGEFVLSLDDLLSTVEDAETGQRGYLITGSGLYLAPYLRAKDQVRERLSDAMGFARTAGVDFAHWGALRAAIDAKMEELELTVKLRDAGQVDAALNEVRSGSGQQRMAQIRHIIGRLKTDQIAVYQRRDQEQLLSERHLRMTAFLWSCAGHCSAAFCVPPWRALPARARSGRSGNPQLV